MATEKKLKYKILGKRLPLDQDHPDLEYIDVEWSHADGPFTDTKIIPITHPPGIEYREVKDGTRDVIKDQINVKRGTSDSVILQILEEKRSALAKNLKVEE